MRAERRAAHANPTPVYTLSTPPNGTTRAGCPDSSVEHRARGDLACVTQSCADCDCPAGWDPHPLAVLAGRQAYTSRTGKEGAGDDLIT